MSIAATLGGAWANLDIRKLTDDEIRAKSSGPVIKPETLNYRTLKPEPGGLFDANVFGDPDEARQLQAAGMDVSWGITPATAQFGHIDLCQAVVHPFYATHGVEELAAAAGLSVDETRQLVDQDLVVAGGDVVGKDLVDPDEVAYGAAAFAELLAEPSDFLVHRLLVAPVATRPMVALPDGNWVTSHINDLYRRAINRNNRLKRLLELNAPAIINMNEQRMLQEAVGNLCFNGFDGLKVITGPDREALVSLFELAQRDARFAADALDGTGPARGVRSLRAFESIGFGFGAAESKQRQKPDAPNVDFSLAGSPVPIPKI